MSTFKYPNVNLYDSLLIYMIHTFGILNDFQLTYDEYCKSNYDIDKI